jgi:hypothetical protein
LRDPRLDRSSGCRLHAVECVEVVGGLQVLRGSMFSKRRRKLARTFPVWNLARFLRFPLSALETESTRKRAASWCSPVRRPQAAKRRRLVLWVNSFFRR